ESWGAYDFTLSNKTGIDRAGRVFAFLKGRPDVQYGRDVWVPANATLSSWMLVGPAFEPLQGQLSDFELLVYERAGGKDQLVSPDTEQQVRTGAARFEKRAPFTTLVLDDEESKGNGFGALPQPASSVDEALLLARGFRYAANLEVEAASVRADTLPPNARAFDGIDHLVIASQKIAHDPAGVLAARRWLLDGGQIWVMLALVDAESVAPLLGDALDFRVVDRVGLTTFKVISKDEGPPEQMPEQDQPVQFARVLLPPQ